MKFSFEWLKGRAEEIADHTRVALAETEAALHDLRTSI